jgi:hypothetical protein
MFAEPVFGEGLPIENTQPVRGPCETREDEACVVLRVVVEDKHFEVGVVLFE